MKRGSTYTLVILLACYMSNYIDRVMIGIFAEPIKADLNLSDSQLGLITGILFALFYAFVGLPIGRLIDRHSRKMIMASCLTLWSLATAMGGLCQNFAQLALTRMMVGVGEAGCTPTAHSLLSDIYPANRRATAISIYSMGVPIGIVAGAIGGGWLAQNWGWRIAMFLVGIPGILLAALITLTIEEPERGRFEESEAAEEPASFKDLLNEIWRQPQVVLILFATGFCAVGLYSVSTFTVPFLMRAYGFDVMTAGTIFGISYGASGAIGAAFGGVITDWAGKRDTLWYTRVPALVYLTGGPLVMLALLQSDYRLFIAFFTLGSLVLNLALALGVAVMINQVRPRMRGSMSAVALFFAAVIGNGFGPTLTGYLSDKFGAHIFGSASYLSLCRGKLTAEASHTACARASYHGLQYALLVAALFWIVTAGFYIAATRARRSDAAKTGLGVAAGSYSSIHSVTIVGSVPIVAPIPGYPERP